MSFESEAVEIDSISFLIPAFLFYTSLAIFLQKMTSFTCPHVTIDIKIKRFQTKIYCYMSLRPFHPNGGVQFDIPNFLECITYQALVDSSMHEADYLPKKTPFFVKKA